MYRIVTAVKLDSGDAKVNDDIYRVVRLLHHGWEVKRVIGPPTRQTLTVRS